MFKLTEQNIGYVKPKKIVEVIFPFSDIEKFTKLESPCDCSTPSFNMKENVVIVKYTPREIPVHLRVAGKTYYTVKKTVTVYFTSTNNQPGIEHMQVLTFTATIKVQ
jgi:hypothetical protein